MSTALNVFLVFNAGYFKTFKLDVTPPFAYQTQANIWFLDPSAILHSQLTHNFSALSGGPLPILHQAHTVVERVQRLAAPVHWYDHYCQVIGSCVTPLKRSARSRLSLQHHREFASREHF
jgi:hypothetical protein